MFFKNKTQEENQMKKTKKNTEDYAAELRSSFERWNTLYEKGGSDPFWPDGTNLNLVRNHIIYYKRMIGETMEKENYPEEYYMDTPAKVSESYMAKENEIREKAKEAVKIFTEDSNYQFLMGRMPFDLKKCPECFKTVPYVKGFQKSVEDDDLVAMRRIAGNKYYKHYPERLQQDRELWEQKFGGMIEIDPILETKDDFPDNFLFENIDYGNQISLFDLIK